MKMKNANLVLTLPDFLSPMKRGKNNCILEFKSSANTCHPSWGKSFLFQQWERVPLITGRGSIKGGRSWVKGADMKSGAAILIEKKYRKLDVQKGAAYFSKERYCVSK